MGIGIAGDAGVKIENAGFPPAFSSSRSIDDDVFTRPASAAARPAADLYPEEPRAVLAQAVVRQPAEPPGESREAVPERCRAVRSDHNVSSQYSCCVQVPFINH